MCACSADVLARAAAALLESMPFMARAEGTSMSDGTALNPSAIADLPFTPVLVLGSLGDFWRGVRATVLSMGKSVSWDDAIAAPVTSLLRTAISALIALRVTGPAGAVVVRG